MVKETILEAMKEDILPVLMKWEEDDNIVILKAEEMPASKPGDNYMWVVTRTNIEGTRGNGKSYKTSFITKKFPEPPVVVKSRTADLFKNEGHVYEHVLPLVGDFAPKLIYASPEKIVLEDLSLQKYYVHDSQSLLDLDPTRAVLKTLGKFHAQSLSLKLKNPDKFQTLIEPLREVAFPSDAGESLGSAIEKTLDVTIKSLESLKTDEPSKENPTSPKSAKTDKIADITKAQTFLKKYQTKAFDTMKKLVNSPGDYHVLIHGDVSITNILFEGSSENMKVKFIDFQASRHASVAIDFSNFIYSSTKTEVIQKHYKELVELYHSSFSETLKELEVSKSKYDSLNMEWFQSELRKYALFGMLNSLSLIPFIFSPEPLKINTTDNLPDIKAPVSLEKSNRMEFIISHYIDNYSS